MERLVTPGDWPAHTPQQQDREEGGPALKADTTAPPSARRVASHDAATMVGYAAGRHGSRGR